MRPLEDPTPPLDAPAAPPKPEEAPRRHQRTEAELKASKRAPEDDLGKVHPDAPDACLSSLEKHGVKWKDRGDEKPGHWINKIGKRICGAHPFQNKGPCKQMDIANGGKCRLHGGLSPRGIASSSYKHGRLSQAMNSKRAKDYADARDDPDLMDMARPLAVLEGNMKEAIARREELDTPHYRKQALAIFKDLEDAMGDDMPRAWLTLKDLGRLLKRGCEEDQANENVGRHTQRFAKVTKDAWGVRLGAAQAINAADLTIVLGRFIEVVIQEAPEEVHGAILRRLDLEVLSGRLAIQSGD